MMARFPKEFIFGRYPLHRYSNKLYSQRVLTLGYRWKTLRLLLSEQFFLFPRMACYVLQPLWVRPENIAVFEEEQRTSANRKKTWIFLSTKQSRVLESTNHVRKRTTSHKFSDLLASEKHFLPVSGRCLLWLRFSTRALYNIEEKPPTKELRAFCGGNQNCPTKVHTSQQPLLWTYRRGKCRWRGTCFITRFFIINLKRKGGRRFKHVYICSSITRSPYTVCLHNAAAIELFFCLLSAALSHI